MVENWYFLLDWSKERFRQSNPSYVPNTNELRYAHAPNNIRCYTTHPTSIRPGYVPNPNALRHAGF